MSVQTLRAAALVLVCVSTLFGSLQVNAAKPTGSGGGNDSTAATNGTAPEFYRVELDHFARLMKIHGVHFIGGDPTAPAYPTDVTVAGQVVPIDTAASLAATDFTTGEGALVVPFNALLDALVGPPTGNRVLSNQKNYEIKVVTSGGAASFSAYVSSDIEDVPVDQGFCPCSFSLYTAQLSAAEPGSTFCSATQGIPTEQYIEAGFGKVDELGNASAVIMGSHSSISPESLYASSCYVRDLSQFVDGVETPVYLEGPVAIGNGDHMLCAAAIEALEPACTP